MADYDVTYQQDSFANATADFDYFSDNASSGDQVVNEPTSNGNAPDWQWTDEASPSTGTGPPAANTGCTYPESSSPAAASDICRATMKTANQVNATTYGLFVDVDICTYGNTGGNLQVQAYDGSTWNTIHTRNGDATTTFTSVTGLDCTAYTNSDFYVRIVVNYSASGNAYQHDFAFRDLRIYGDLKIVNEIDGITYDEAGSALGSCICTLYKDNGDDTITYFDRVTSNASTGAFTFSGIASADASFFIVATKADTPDVVDVSERTIQPAVSYSGTLDLYLRSQVDKSEIAGDGDLRLRSQSSKIPAAGGVTIGGSLASLGVGI